MPVSDPTYDKILSALRAGASIEDIGNDFASTLNAAQKAYEIEQENARKAQERKRDSEKHIRIEKLIAEFLDWIRDFQPKLYTNLNIDDLVNKYDIVDLGDSIISYLKTFEHLTDLIDITVTSSEDEKGAPSPRTEVSKSWSSKDTKDMEDVTRAFNEVFGRASSPSTKDFESMIREWLT